MADATRRVSELRLRRRVQFHETDAAGIVHFSRYVIYMEEAEHALWRSAGLSIAARGAPVGWPRTSVSVEYRRPLHFEEEFEVLIRIAAIEERKIRYACELSRDGECVATGAMTIVAVKKDGDGPMRSVPIPDEIRKRFEVAQGE